MSYALFRANAMYGVERFKYSKSILKYSERKQNYSERNQKYYRSLLKPANFTYLGLTFQHFSPKNVKKIWF